MSTRIAGNQTGERHSRDDYPTDPAWTRALMDHQRLEGPVWEPAAGEGAMVSTLEEEYEVTATSIETGTDFLVDTRRAHSIVTNPPYRLLTPFIEHGLRQTDRFLCLLAGWHSLAGGVQRANLVWSVNPPNRALVVPQRMVVRGKPSQFNHVWLIWDVTQPASSTSLEWVNAVSQSKRDMSVYQ